jgi:hypothetical protein
MQDEALITYLANAREDLAAAKALSSPARREHKLHNVIEDLENALAEARHLLKENTAPHRRPARSVPHRPERHAGRRRPLARRHRLRARQPPQRHDDGPRDRRADPLPELSMTGGADMTAIDYIREANAIAPVQAGQVIDCPAHPNRYWRQVTIVHRGPSSIPGRDSVTYTNPAGVATSGLVRRDPEAR